MGRIAADRIVRKLDEAEGYLMLGLPGRTLEILDERDDWATMKFEAALLRGLSFRALERHREAIGPLEAASRLRPRHLEAALALAWCYKRTNCLAQAIDALAKAAEHHPDEALVRYNLACYWSLAGNPAEAIAALGEAADLDPDVLDLVAAESDFDPVRNLEEFGRLLAGREAQA